jgi:hypothetical protein
MFGVSNCFFDSESTLQRPGVTIEVRTRLIQNNQAGRLTKKMAIPTPPTNSTLGG